MMEGDVSNISAKDELFKYTLNTTQPVCDTCMYVCTLLSYSFSHEVGDKRSILFLISQVKWFVLNVETKFSENISTHLLESPSLRARKQSFTRFPDSLTMIRLSPVFSKCNISVWGPSREHHFQVLRGCIIDPYELL